MTRRAVVGIGSNLGDRAALVEAAFRDLAALPGTTSVARSSLWETDPVGVPDGGAFVNAAACVRTALDARAILDLLLDLERRAGRVRARRNEPRVLDLDLLWVDGETRDEPGLVVPHPRLAQRAFALVPLLDVAPDARDPRTGETYATALARVGRAGVRPFTCPAPPAARRAT